MAEHGFTILLDTDESADGKKDRDGKKSEANASRSSSVSASATSTVPGSDSAVPDFTAGPTQGPFVAKSQHPEFADIRMTDEGIKTIIRQEGYRGTAYPDAAGYSVGYGHFLGEGDSGKDTKISPEQGLKYLANDLKKFEKQISSRIKVPLSDDQFTALVSFAYNAGAGSLDKGISAKINAGDMQGAADQMKLYVKSKDAKTKQLTRNEHLVKRREFETGLLLGGKK
jgi:GH24 family phage-related lysozyme (muramidase)